MLESSHRDNSNKWSNTEFTEEITCVVSINVYVSHISVSRAMMSFSKENLPLTNDINEMVAFVAFQN